MYATLYFEPVSPGTRNRFHLVWKSAVNYVAIRRFIPWFHFYDPILNDPYNDLQSMAAILWLVSNKLLPIQSYDMDF